MEICEECACNCRPVSINCIIENCDIQDAATIQSSLFVKATSNIDDLIGEDCAEELCIALEAASEAATAAESTDPIAYLADKWKKVIQNKHFKAWYSNKIQWHFLNGASISEIVSSKLVTTTDGDSNNYKDAYSRAAESERKRLQGASDYYASQFKDKFLKYYWNKNTHLYNCAVKDCGCCKSYTCKQHKCEDRGSEIGMIIG